MKSSPLFCTFVLVFLLLTGCKNEDDVTSVILQNTEYRLNAVGSSTVTGTATLTQDSEGTTEVLIQLDDGSSTAVHPAYIRFNSAEEGGNIALTLTDCECAISRTTVSKLDNGTSISYDDLLRMDAHISIHESSSNLTVISAANIGVNANPQ